MGFGHRVYRAEDPRARHMRAGVEQLSREMGEPQWYQILAALVEAMKPYARHGVNVNVDFYAGVVYFLNGIAEDLFVPIFAVGRVPGWTVQVLEQIGEQHPDPAADALQRPARARLRAPFTTITDKLMSLRVADAIVRALEAHGLSRVYCVPAKAILRFSTHCTIQPNPDHRLQT